MSTVALFGGTSEGRQLAQELVRRGVKVSVYVATGYGEELLEPYAGLEVTARRMNRTDMEALLRMYRFTTVVDATHPYAVEVTANLREACIATGTKYLRLTRESLATDNCQRVDSATEAAQLVDTLPGNVLLTVGSKELAAFTQVENYRQRLFARVLPDPEVVAKCAALGFRGRNLICMQGPFTHEMNTATIQMLGITTVVTKDTGREGGFPEKISAAAECGVTVVLIRRPDQEEEGHTLQSIQELLAPQTAPEPAPVPRFPVFLNLENKPVLVVGGGQIAARRVETLLCYGAAVTVVSPELCPALSPLAHRITWVQGPYDGLAETYALAVAATDQRTVNHQVGLDCGAAGIPVSVADRREESTFWFPATVRQEGLSVGLTAVDCDHKRVKRAAQIIRTTLEEGL